MINAAHHATHQTDRARNLGREAYERGELCAPALDHRVIDLIAGRPVGTAPQGEATTAEIFRAWTAGWVTANLEGDL